MLLLLIYQHSPPERESWLSTKPAQTATLEPEATVQGQSGLVPDEEAAPSTFG